MPLVLPFYSYKATIHTTRLLLEYNMVLLLNRAYGCSTARRVNRILFTNAFFFLVWMHKWLIDRRIFHRTRAGKQGALILNSFNNTVALPECHGQWPWDQEFKFYAVSPTLSVFRTSLSRISWPWRRGEKKEIEFFPTFDCSNSGISIF